MQLVEQQHSSCTRYLSLSISCPLKIYRVEYYSQSWKLVSMNPPTFMFEKEVSIGNPLLKTFWNDGVDMVAELDDDPDAEDEGFPYMLYR